MKILIAEDDVELVKSIKYALEVLSYTVDVTYDGNEASYLGRVNDYDLIVIDLSIPNKNGAVVCSEIRSSGKSVPILFISVVNEIRRKVEIFNIGADDYLTKPFSLEELTVRIKALLRRPGNLFPKIIKVGDLSIDITSQKVCVGDNQIHLTKKEYSLLEYLLRNKGKIVSRAMLLEHIWDSECNPFTNTVESHVLNLRKKILKHMNLDLISNIPGRGYTIENSNN